MKKLSLIFFSLLAAVALIVVWFYINIQPVSGNKDFKTFLIAKGAPAGQVASKLESGGFIKSALAFKIYTRLSGTSGKIIAGEYRLTPSFNLFQVIGQFLRGPQELWVTIPEGLRREEIAQKFAQGLDRDQTFVSEFLRSSAGKEGTLFPDTYLFAKDASASSVVNKMTRTFDSKTNTFSAAGNLNFDQRIILASIIERETKTEEERPIVAGILINRLNIDMALQVDATVQYAVGNQKNWWPILTLEDLETKSPYNTYKYPGLPPGPICSPGLSSINAAFNPSESNYFYYIHDKQGQIHYARTLDEQNANIAKYLR